MAKVEKYYLRVHPSAPWQRVTKEVWITVERSAGFRPKGISSTDPAFMTTCATGGFGSGSISGTIRYEEEDAPITSARNVGELRRLIECLHDEMPLVRPAHDHEYRTAHAEVTTGLRDRSGAWTEDHGEDVTPEATWGKRIPVLLVK